MNDRAVSLFEKYDLIIEKTRKGRGAIIADSNVGEVALVEYSGPQDHLAMEEALLCQIEQNYKKPLDLIIRTTEGELFCTDYEGKKYIVKKYVEGKECDVTDEAECKKAARALAQLHQAMRRLDVPEEIIAWEKADNLLDDFDRRTAEIVRTRNYIRKCSHKDEFELSFLRAFDCYMEQSAVAYSFLDTDCLEALKEKQIQESMLIHGDCTHHNIRFIGDDISFVNFEKMGAHLQTKDIYLFMRKILEKNDWSYRFATQMLQAYEQVLPLEAAEKNYLYARFVYPEKFWKIANGYLNRRKSVPAKRQQEKLSAFEQKEEKRQLFLNKWLETCR